MGKNENKKACYTADDVTIVICAYKQCDYLEDCIKSITGQTMKCKTVISTSTPNDYISDLAQKYNLEIKVNANGGHANDYNFALEQCGTKLCIMAHQDDLLDKSFVEESVKALSEAKNPIISFTDYREIHDNVIDEQPSGLVKIKKLLLLPMKIPGVGRGRFGKRLILRFGDPISHPTVTYVVDKMPEKCFRSEFRSAMDWDLWERLSNIDGSFVYVNKPLHFHRMHKEQAMAVIVNDDGEDIRYLEDFELFSRFWPKCIAKLIMKFYSKSQKVYN